MGEEGKTDYIRGGRWDADAREGKGRKEREKQFKHPR